jgi:hypothetical protein
LASKTPHYVRVARALALVTALAGAPACSSSTTPDTDSGSGDTDGGGMIADAGGGGTDAGGGGTDSGSGGTDSGTSATDSGALADSGHAGHDSGTAVADAGQPDAGIVHTCATCVCTWGADAGPVVSCEAIGMEVPCCIAIGPLFPPDLAA